MFVCLEIESSAFWGGLSACPANPGQVKADTLTHDLTHSKADRQQQGTHTDCQTFCDWRYELFCTGTKPQN